MQEVTNVSAGAPATGGAVSVAPSGSALPTDAVTALAEAFKPLGYCSEDGLTNNNTPNTTEVKAWGGDTVLVTNDGKTDTFGYTLIEVLNVEVLKHALGDGNVTGTLAEGITVKANNKPQAEHVVVVDMIMRGGALKRIVIPRGVVTSVGEVTYSDKAAVGYAITLTAFADTAGNTHYEYIIGAQTTQTTQTTQATDETEGGGNG